MRTKLKVDTRNTSDQDRRTPQEFIDLVEERFGPIVFDLAAKKGHSVNGLPCFTPEQDALKQDWLRCDAFGSGADRTGNRWLNPPFNRFPEFTKQAGAQCSFDRPILMLTLASVGANWYWDNVVPNAFTFAIDRIQFVGESDPFTKDLLLHLFGFGSGGGLIQRWRTKVFKRPRGIIPP